MKIRLRYVLSTALFICLSASLFGCGSADSSDNAIGGDEESHKEVTDDNTSGQDGNSDSKNQNTSPANEYDSSSNGGNRHAGEPAGDRGDYQQGEEYNEVEENNFIETSKEDTSTFSIDVDTAAYTIMRRDLNNGTLPKKASVRTEAFINYFDYDYPQPKNNRPFSIRTEVGPSKFGDNKQLLHIGLQGKEIPVSEMAPTNLVFLIDVSGSMSSPHKLGLVKESLKTLLDTLRPSDTVGIVVYAGSDGVVLEPTPVEQEQKIETALEQLQSGGSTNAEAGIVSAYEMAEKAKIQGGNNRVVLVTDGDFNVGRTGDALVDLIEKYRKKQISLTAAGYGMGNYKGGQMENLAQKGNGNYFYVDKEAEAKRIFGEDLPSTLEVIAADVKTQVEFNSDVVKKYRLVGYENRVMDNEDFEDDSKDAGEIGPGHTVTALYEVELKKEPKDQDVLARLSLRYKDQYGDSSKELNGKIRGKELFDSFDKGTTRFRFSAAAAEFAEILRDSKHSTGANFDTVVDIAKNANPDDTEARKTFVDLVEKAKSLWPRE